MVVELEKEGYRDREKRPMLDLLQAEDTRVLRLHKDESLRRFGLDNDVLKIDPSTWQEKSSFQETDQKLPALSMIKDNAERGVALI